MGVWKEESVGVKRYDAYYFCIFSTIHLHPHTLILLYASVSLWFNRKEVNDGNGFDAMARCG